MFIRHQFDGSSIGCRDAPIPEGGRIDTQARTPSKPPPPCTGAPIDREEIAKADEILIYVHGFNNTFDEAIETAGRLKYRFQFEGPVIAYSWPSVGSLFQYSPDVNTAHWAAIRLSDELEDIFARATQSKIFIIAHSMGARIAMDALLITDWRKRQDLVDRTKIIFADPDVSMRSYLAFESKLAPLHNRPTIYVAWDMPLWFSGFRWDERRAGDAIAWSELAKTNTKSDIIGINVDFWEYYGSAHFGHNYFRNDLFLDDIHDTMRGCTPDDRLNYGRLVPDKKTGIKIYWIATSIDEVAARNRGLCPVQKSAKAG